MIGISKLYCGQAEPSDALRYGRDSGTLPSHLLQFSADKKPVVVWNMTRRCNLKCIHCYAQAKDFAFENELTTAQGQLRNVTTPEVSPSPDNHPVFALALEDIEAGKFTKARQRLYALLSVVDRMDPADRDKVEARANYLIAHAWQLEVVTRTEGDR